jgi:acyl carrier protein
MNKEDFLIGFQEQFEDTDPSLITFDTKYKDLDEWSSMMSLIIIAFVDESFTVTLSGDDFKNTSTVEELYNAAANK